MSVVRIASGKFAKVGDRVWVWVTGGLRDKYVQSISGRNLWLVYRGEFGDRVKKVMPHSVTASQVYKTKEDAVRLNPKKAQETECAAARNSMDRGIQIGMRRAAQQLKKAA